MRATSGSREQQVVSVASVSANFSSSSIFTHFDPYEGGNISKRKVGNNTCSLSVKSQ